MTTTGTLDYAIVDLALEEDLGSGDVTSIATIPEDMTCTATIIAKELGVSPTLVNFMIRDALVHCRKVSGTQADTFSRR